jgi:hypothetical protein
MTQITLKQNAPGSDESLDAGATAVPRSLLSMSLNAETPGAEWLGRASGKSFIWRLIAASGKETATWKQWWARSDSNARPLRS